jgi:hypothetical protein
VVEKGVGNIGIRLSLMATRKKKKNFFFRVAATKWSLMTTFQHYFSGFSGRGSNFVALDQKNGPFFWSAGQCRHRPEKGVRHFGQRKNY